MNPLSKNEFIVKEHVCLFKAANNFDMYDPDSEHPWLMPIMAAVMCIDRVLKE